MKAATKARCVEIANEIRELAFIAAKAKNPREQFYRIDRLAREASDYFAFGFEVKPEPSPEQPTLGPDGKRYLGTGREAEPTEYGFTCGVFGCEHDDSETKQVSYPTMGAALEAAAEHRLTHNEPSRGIVTTETGS